MKKILLLLLFPICAFSQSVTISGKVKDLNESLPFVNIIVRGDGKQFGTASDLDGNYSLSISKGEWRFEVSAVGYKPISLLKSVSEDEILVFELIEDKQLLNEVVVTTVANKQTSTAVVSTIRTLPVVADGVSSEFIRKTPDRNVADALRRVSGVTIQSDRFVLVRGLADRYNLARLNKTGLPSTEPDRRAFSFDVIPSSLIDNIIVIKSSSSDLPGDFTGGLISVTTKEIDDNFTTINVGTSWGSVTTFSGMKLVKSTEFPTSFPSTYTYRNASLNERRSYSQQIKTPNENNFTAIPNSNFGFSLGRDLGKFKGVFSSVLRSTSSVNYIQRKDWQSSTELAYDYADTLYSKTNSVSSLLNLTYLGKEKYSWKTIFTHQSTNNFLTRYGENYDNLQNVKTNSSNHFQTTIVNSQIDGRVYGVSFDGGYNFTYRTQPDYRVNPIVKSLDSDESFSTAWRDTYRFWSVMNEHAGSLNLSREISNFRLGGGIQKRFRSFNARIFRYDSEDLLSDITNNTDRYDADVNFLNLFGLYKKTFDDFEVSTGIRTESALFKINTADFSGQPISVNAKFVNLLPSANISYNLENSKFRLSLSKSVARPEFREVANFAYYDFVRNAQLIGNPNLQISRIYNFDLKYEWYFSKGENLFISLFGKHFDKPIEQIVDSGSVPSNLILTYTNPNSAKLIGIEVELRKTITNWLNVYTNTSIINSSVNVNGINRQLQGQSKYVINNGINFTHTKNSLNISYNRVGDRISAVGFEGYGDIFENSRDIVDITYLRKVGKTEFKFSVNDLFAQPSVYYQKLQTKRSLIKTNNEQVISLTLNYTL